jgi:hypothetical protein
MIYVIVFLGLGLFVFGQLPGLLALLASLIFTFLFYLDASPPLNEWKIRREFKNQ